VADDLAVRYYLRGRAAGGRVFLAKMADQNKRLGVVQHYQFLHVLTPVSIIALLTTLVLLFSFKGEIILQNPLTIFWIAIPLFIQTVFIFALGYGVAKLLKLSYQDAAPAAMIGASNHFEVAIATATMLFGLSSGASLATVVGVLIEVPVMLMLVSICKRTSHWFES